MIALKLSSALGQERISLDGGTSFAEFVETVSKKTSIPIDKCQISTGFPPKIIHGEASDILSSFKMLSSGSLVIARDGVASLTSSGAIRKEVLRLVSMGFSLAVSEQSMEIAGDDMDLALEIAQGIAAATETPASSIKKKRVITRRIIDADNSCLFNALGYLMERDKHRMCPIYRQVIVDEIRSNEATYSADILGMSTEDYVTWILNPEKWGGEIEMNILSKYLKVEIAAVDIQTGKHYVYGADSNFNMRVYVLYDGVHYDAITSSIVSADGISSESSDITIFASDDTTISDQTVVMASELRKKKQFVSLAGCGLQCLVCLKGLKGQKDAQAHAKDTGHQNFGQVDI